MTTVQTMLPRGDQHAHGRAGSARRVRGRLAALAGLALACAAGLTGCAKPPELIPPDVLVAPYSQAQGPPTWAVAPLVNESGTTSVDPGAVTDALIAKVAETRGLAVLPLNRTLAAMRSLRMTTVRSPADARALAQTLGVEGLIVGTITAYDPYDPPKLGLTIGLFLSSLPGANRVDPRQLQASPSEPAAPRASEEPASVVSDYADAANHEVLMDLRRYAAGRHDANSALGWKRFTSSMDLYTEFAAHRTLGRLLDAERLRLARAGVATGAPAR